MYLIEMDLRKAYRVLAGFVFAGVVAQPALAATGVAAQLVEAGELYRAGYYDRAIEAYEPLLTDEGAGVKAAVGLTRALLQVGRYVDALKHLDAVRERGEASAGWHWARGRVLREVGRYPEAIAHGQRALKIEQGYCAARLLLGQLYEIVGQRTKTIETYQWFNQLLQERLPSKAEDVTCAGRGFYRYSQLTRHERLKDRTRYVLQELYQLAYERLDRTYWPARLAAAELLLDKHNLEQAAEDFKAAFKINKNLPRAYLGLGRIALERWGFERVETAVRDALAINPNSVAAFNLLAAARMTERRYAEAAEQCDRALRINPNDIEALSLKAAALLRQRGGVSAKAYVDRVAKINPRSGLVHFIIGTWLSAGRQFPEAETHFVEAIRREPQEPDYRTELGMMYMQWGYESKARTTLEAAWDLDEYNRRTYNTLELLEMLEGFEVYESEHFQIKYRGKRDGIPAPYFARYLESIYQDLAEDYGAALTERTIVEIFPRHEQFAVRITGRPWIHTIGASTGRVIALDAPRPDAHPTGPFHWARVLRHEFTHTVTLAATRNRIPHWFTEGLAVWEEEAPRSWSWVMMLTEAIRADRLFTLKSIDWGFIRPKRPTDRPLAYAQSEWMVEYIIETYEYATINKMIQAFRDGKTQKQVFKETMRVTPPEFSAAFAKWAKREAARWGVDTTPYENAVKLKAALLIKSKDASLHAKLAERLLADGEYDKAVRRARKALELNPDHRRAIRVVMDVQMRLAERTKNASDRDELYDEVRRLGKHLWRLNPTSAVAARHLAAIALRHEEMDEALLWYQRLKRLCPLDQAAWRGLGAIYLERKQSDKALPELIRLSQVDEGDVSLRRRIAEILDRKEDQRGAIRWYTEALHIDPYLPQTHKDLARLYMKADRIEEAIMEYGVLCELEPTVADHFSQLAFAYDRRGKKHEARKAAKKAIKLDSDSPAKSLLE